MGSFLKLTRGVIYVFGDSSLNVSDRGIIDIVQKYNSFGIIPQSLQFSAISVNCDLCNWAMHTMNSLVYSCFLEPIFQMPRV